LEYLGTRALVEGKGAQVPGVGIGDGWGQGLLVIGYWLLVIGYWLLVIGYWLLVVGCWLLVVGCW
jgi:hypothetical protein